MLKLIVIDGLSGIETVSEAATLRSRPLPSIQTVTTVGYGDIVPKDTFGRLIAGLVMISGIGFIAVITATITAAFIESARRRGRTDSDAQQDIQLKKIDDRLARIEKTLENQDRPN